MSIQTILRRGIPDPVEVEGRSVVEQAWTSPLFAPLRLFWVTLEAFRPWWPVLLPLLAVLGLRTYQHERRIYQFELAIREALGDERH